MTDELSERRKQVLRLLDRVPKGKVGLSSDDPTFYTMTNLNTASLTKWWNEHPPGTEGAELTSCNPFVGWVARQIGAKPGSVLASNTLRLDRAGTEVPGSWIVPTSGLMPKPGDFYAQPFVSKDGWVQKFGHVGVIAAVHDWLFFDTVDGGQGGRGQGMDFIRWNMDRLYTGEHVTGWVDIDLYFAGR